MYANREFHGDGYVLLAAAIIEAYREDYSQLFPKCCKDLLEYRLSDIRTFAPQRRSMLRSLERGPLHSIFDYDKFYTAFERSRKEQMHKYGITWSEAYEDYTS